MKAQEEKRVGFIIVRHETEMWNNKEQIARIVLNKHVLSISESISLTDTDILKMFDIDDVIIGKITSNGSQSELTFDDAYDMLSETHEDGSSYSHIAMLNTTNDEIYLCGLEKHENEFNGKKITWYYQWFEEESDTNSFFVFRAKTEHGEDCLYMIGNEDISYDDTMSATCELHHIVDDTYMLEYSSGVGEYKNMIVFNINKKFCTEYFVYDDEDTSFRFDQISRNVIIHTKEEDVIINTEDGTSTKRKNQDSDEQ